MQTQNLSGDDIRFLAQQQDYEVDIMVGQMTTLMQNITSLQNDTDDKVKQLESQNWFKRMTNTLFGKNKATKQEIQKNNDKVVTYISQSVSQLYQMNLINERVICSLGNRMNEVYAQVTEMYTEQLNMKAQISEIMAIQQQTLETMGTFVTKLNEKIESVDNFHMLVSEVQNGMYCDSSRLYNLCSVLSQLDKRQMEDSRKMSLLRDTMKKTGIIIDNEVTVLQCLQEIIALPQEKIGLIYLELCNFRNSFPANLFADMIESYHFLSKMEKMSKKKETIIQRVLDKYELDADAAFSVADIAESFIENKQDSLVNIDNIQIAVNDEIAVNDSYDYRYDDSNDEFEDDNDSDDCYSFINDYDYVYSWAIRGDGAAMDDLGMAYENGEDDEDFGIPGVYQDEEKAAQWYLKSAEAGFPFGMIHFAICCRFGDGIKQNYQRALKWFKKALNYDETEYAAKNYLAVMYFWGFGTEPDLYTSYNYISDIEDTDNYRGDVLSCHAIMLLNGVGGALQDVKRAMEIFKQSRDFISLKYIYAYHYVRGYAVAVARDSRRKTLYQLKEKSFKTMLSTIQRNYRDNTQYDEDGDEIDAFDYVDNADLESFWDYCAYLQSINDYQFLKEIQEKG